MSNNLRIAPSAIVCEQAELKGDITIGENTIVHPTCRIIADGGPIVIGDYNVLEEGTVIENVSVNAGDLHRPVLTLGSNNLIEVGSEIRSRLVGDGNVFEPKCSIGTDSIIGNNCIIGPKVEILAGQQIDDRSVIVLGPDGRYIRRKQRDHVIERHEVHMDSYIEALSSKKSKWYMGNFHHFI